MGLAAVRKKSDSGGQETQVTAEEGTPLCNVSPEEAASTDHQAGLGANRWLL